MSELVGPGALTVHGSEPRRRRSRGTVYVNDPAVGFFVAGSSLNLNGIFVRKDPRRLLGCDTAALAYVLDNGWTLALMEGDNDDDYEWQFLDPARQGILRHDGDTLIPGSGRRWRHVVPSASKDDDDASISSLFAAALAETKSTETLEDELPWQVIALLDAGIVRDLLASKRYRDSRVARSLSGKDLRLNAFEENALRDEEGWFYRVTADFVDLGGGGRRRKKKFRGELLRVTQINDDDDTLLVEDRYVVASSTCEAASRPRLPVGADLDDQEEDLYDKPFEPRILEDDDGGRKADDQDQDQPEDDDDDQDQQEESTLPSASVKGDDHDQADRYEVAQPRRAKEVGSACVVIREGRAVGGTVAKDDGGYRVSVLFEGGAASRPVLVDARAVQADSDAAWLGVDVGDRVNFTTKGLVAAYRAAERDAIFEARLKGGTSKDHSKARRDAFRALKPRVFSPPGGDSQKGPSPLEAVARGAAGARAASAAKKATSSTLAEATRGVAALRQVVCDEAARVSAVAARGGGVVSVVDDFGDDDLCRLRLAASTAAVDPKGDECAFALAALEAGPSCAAPLVVVALNLLRLGTNRDEAAAKLKAAIDLGPRAGPDAAWAAREAATCLRGISRATRLKVKADDAYRRGNLAAANDYYADAVSVVTQKCPKDAWLLATLHANRAACRRRLRQLDGALSDATVALSLFPRYQKALFRRAVVLVELDRPASAKRAFLELLRVNRNWPKLAEWLTRCVANLKRKNPKARWADDDDDDDDDGNEDDDANDDANDEGSSSFSSASGTTTTTKQKADLPEKMSNPDEIIDHYSVLGVDADVSHSQLKRAYRLRSLKFHPDKASGSTVAFQRVAEAFDVLSDPEKRSQYDLGEDLKKKKKKNGASDDSSDDDSDSDRGKERSLHEQVERLWFPERYEFYPFGDPFVEKRKLRAKRERQQQRSQNNYRTDDDKWWDPSSL